MENALSMTEISRHFADYINRVAYHGEHFILVRGKKRLAELRPVPVGKYLGELPRLWESLPHLSKEEAETFAKDLLEMRNQLLAEELGAPWES